MEKRPEELGFKVVEPAKLADMDFNPFKKINNEWFLVTAGDENGWNTMTASWGFAGIIWGKQTFTTVIRPQRYTKEFLDKADSFTICFFKEDQKKALAFCGSHSGRDCDKAAETGLMPLFFDGVTAFEQADMILVCDKTYVQQMTKEAFREDSIPNNDYSIGDYHYQYIGVIKQVYVK